LGHIRELVGYEIDLCNMLSKYIGVKAQLTPISPHTCGRTLRLGSGLSLCSRASRSAHGRTHGRRAASGCHYKYLSISLYLLRKRRFGL
jgi:hypothetical protein